MYKILLIPIFLILNLYTVALLYFCKIVNNKTLYALDGLVIKSAYRVKTIQNCRVVSLYNTKSCIKNECSKNIVLSKVEFKTL